jgi:hypothetical protein
VGTLKNQCTNYGGLWGPATFEDFEINDLVHIGYVCRAST